MAKSLFRIFMKFFMAIGRISGLEVLLLSTRGRKTRQTRTTPLGYFKDQQGNYVIITSNAGFDTHPAWFYNLKSQPQVTIQVKDTQLELEANAEIAGPDNRSQLWAQLIKLAPFYDNYTKKSSREIPVVILHPVHI